MGRETVAIATRSSVTNKIERLKSFRGALDVHVKDVHIEAINKHAILDKANTDTLDQDALAGSSTIEVSNSSQYSANDRITIVEGNIEESDIMKVITSDGTNPGTLTLDKPLENKYTTVATVISQVDQDLSNGNGTIAAPVVYQIAPPSNEVWHIHTIVIHGEDGTAPGVETFIGISALTNGLVIRQNNGTKKNLVILRTNGDMKEYFGGNEVTFLQKVGGGDHAVDAIWHLEEHTGAIVKLDGSINDTLQFIIQDNLTANTDLEVICQGHKEGI